jgi:hypothetical protein
MRSNKNNLLNVFIENFKEELDLKDKVNISENNQLGEITEYLQNYFSKLNYEIKNAKVTAGNNPVGYLDFKKKISEEVLIKSVCNYFKSYSIAFKKHKFSGCRPLFSLKNNTIPGLVEGRGYSLVSFVSKMPDSKVRIKIEPLKETQVIKTLDAKFNNLTLVLWNGRTMIESNFISGEINLEEEIPTHEGFFNIELISDSPKIPIKIKGDFYLSSDQDLILEKITDIARG